MTGISHKQAIKLIDLRLDGSLNERETLSLDEHLRSCDTCRTYSTEMDALPSRLQVEFHHRWDKNQSLSQNVIEQLHCCMIIIDGQQSLNEIDQKIVAPRINPKQSLPRVKTKNKKIYKLHSFQIQFMGGLMQMKKKTLTRQIGVLFTDEIYNKLTQITDSREEPISAFIRKIVLSYLEYHGRKGGSKNDNKQ